MDRERWIEKGGGEGRGRGAEGGGGEMIARYKCLLQREYKINTTILPFVWAKVFFLSNFLSNLFLPMNTPFSFNKNTINL